ncbi:MAG: hypothetical protein Q6L68_02725 [Thermostichus sp. DG02_5_bins_236]
MVSQPFDAGRSRNRLPVRPKGSALPPRHRERLSSPTPSLSGKINCPRPLKSAHPDSREPDWVEQLSWWKQISTGIAIVSGFSVLSLYSWTVHTQSQWSQRYQVWQQMQRNERQFLLTQESIANSLRETASRSEMVPLVPDRMIEVPIALPSQQELGQSSEEHPPKTLGDAAKEALFYPIGY